MVAGAGMEAEARTEEVADDEGWGTREVEATVG